MIDGRYHVGERLGGGGFGHVYAATDAETGRPVALKILHRLKGYEGLDSFRREILAARQIEHPAMPRILDYGVTTDGSAFLVLERVHGRPLSSLLAAGRRIGVVECAELLRPVAGLLAEAHARGVIHCDVKQSHILVDERDGLQVKLLDFGIAAVAPGEHGAHETTTSGTPGYMAPERIYDEPFDGRADVYALGVILYEALTGRHPHGTPSGDTLVWMRAHARRPPVPLREVLDQPSATLGALVERCLVPDPRLRPTAAELEGYLELEQRFGLREPGLWSLDAADGGSPVAVGGARSEETTATPAAVSSVAPLLSGMERSLARGDLFGRFYERFIASSAEVARRFARTDIEAQKRTLRFGLGLLLLHADGDPVGRWTLEQVRRSHSSEGLDIPPALYDLWLEALIESLAELDPAWTAALEARWCGVLREAIDVLIGDDPVPGNPLGGPSDPLAPSEGGA